MRFFVYFFERYLTFCKEGLSLTGGCGEVPEFSPRVQVVCVCGFWLFAVIPKRAQFRCLWTGGRTCAQWDFSELEHTTQHIFFVPKQSKTAEKFNYLVWTLEALCCLAVWAVFLEPPFSAGWTVISEFRDADNWPVTAVGIMIWLWLHCCNAIAVCLA